MNLIYCIQPKEISISGTLDRIAMMPIKVWHFHPGAALLYFDRKPLNLLLPSSDWFLKEKPVKDQSLFNESFFFDFQSDKLMQIKQFPMALEEMSARSCWISYLTLLSVWRNHMIEIGDVENIHPPGEMSGRFWGRKERWGFAWDRYLNGVCLAVVIPHICTVRAGWSLKAFPCMRSLCTGNLLEMRLCHLMYLSRQR